MPIANDPDQERRLWDTTRELLNQALAVVRQRILVRGRQDHWTANEHAGR